jgi:hypothetical protein
MTATFNVHIINNTIFMFMTRNLLDSAALGVYLFGLCLFGPSPSERRLSGGLSLSLLPLSLLTHLPDLDCP